MITAHTHISTNELKLWRGVQFTLWLIGVAILLALFFAPDIGIHAFWNVLIPIAPALLVVSTGLWRNICPLSSTVLFPRHINRSVRKHLSPKLHAIFSLTAVILLFLIVPLRHVVLDTNGPATGLAIVVIATLALIISSRFEWKSAWCSGLCPVHPVEKLYGMNPVIAPKNTHCSLCEQCVVPCPDSTRAINPLATRKSRLHQMAGAMIIGGFPGFIWGWFQVPDYHGTEGWMHLPEAYLWPLGGMLITLVLFLLLKQFLPKEKHLMLTRFFAFASVACYYWFRLPLLFGFGLFPGDGMLVDLSSTMPHWFPYALQGITTLLFAWLILLREPNKKRSWTVRPPFARTGLQEHNS